MADDEPLIRTALAETLSAAGLDVVGQASNGEAAIELVLALRPDVVVTAITLPGIVGVNVIERLSRLVPASRVLVLTHSEQNRVVEAIIAGASGYILKNAPPEQIINAVTATAGGESVLSPQIAGKLLDHIRENSIPVTTTSQTAADSIRATLTARELEIFRMLASGKTNQQIGRELQLSTNTVRNHIKSILDKLQLDNRIQAAAQAVRAGIS